MKNLLLAFFALILVPCGVYAQPVISSLSSYSGAPGSTVTINGSGFNSTAANNAVYFGATRATVTMASSTVLNVTVPVGATYVPPTVRNTATNMMGSAPAAFLPTYDNSHFINDSVHFDDPINLPFAESAAGITTCDIDGDGKADIVATNYYFGVSILRNTSTPGYLAPGGFATSLYLPLGLMPSTTLIEDLNGDGKPDIITLVPGSDGLKASIVCVYMNNSTPGSLSTGSFSARIDLPVVRSCSYIAVKDMDGDGKPDIVCAGQSMASILRNTISGSTVTAANFSSRTDFSVSCFRGMKVQDLDGDNKPEIIVANLNTISVFKNNCTPGNITSTLLVNSFSRTSSTQIAGLEILDADGDQKTDIAYLTGTSAASSAKTLRIIRNVTTGAISSSSFAADAVTTLGTLPMSMAAGDINGDGKPDLVVANVANSFVVLLNTTSATGISYTTRGPIATGAHPTWVAVGDVDGDALPDVMFGGQNGVASLLGVAYRNSALCTHPIAGSTTICAGASTTLTGGSAGGTWISGDAAVATVDPSTGVVTGVTAGTATITYNAGSFTAFLQMRTIALPTPIAGPSSACIGSIITLSDEIAGGTWSSSTGAVATIGSTGMLATVGVGTTTVSYSTGCGAVTANIPVNAPPAAITGTGSVGAGATTTLSNTTTGGTWLAADTAVASIGVTGVVTGNNAGITTVAYKLATGCQSSIQLTVNALTLAPPVITSVSVLTDTPGSSIVISGANFGSAPGNNTVWFGATKANVTSASSGSLTATVPLSASYGPVSVTNRLSGMTGMAARSFIPAYNNSANLNLTDFDPVVEFEHGFYFSAAGCVDMDGDGKPDVVTVSGQNVCLFRNTTTAGTINGTSFADKVCFAAPNAGSPAQEAFKLEDIDGDGKKDIIMLFQTSIAQLTILRNTSVTGSFSFQSPVNFPAGYGGRSLEVADFNSDGKPDIAVTDGTLSSSSGCFSIFRNTSVCGVIDTTSLAARINFTTNSNPAYLTARDIDGDGKPDLVVVTDYSPTFFSVYRNTTTSTISFATKVDISPGATVNAAVLIEDVDGDGKPDLIVPKVLNSKFAVYRNVSTPGAFTTASLAAGVNFDGMYNLTRWACMADMNGDGKADLVTLQGQDNTLCIYKNTSTAGAINTSSFAARTTYPFAVGSMMVADLDGDKMPDVAGFANYKLTVAHQRPVKITPASMLCAGTTKTLSDITAGGTWSSGSTGIATIGSASGIATGVSTGHALITYTKPGGGIDTTSLFVHAAPGAISGPSAVCEGTRAIVYSDPVAGGRWITNTTLHLTIDTMGFAEAVDTGIVVLTYATGCLPNASKTIAVGHMPAAITGITNIYVGLTTTLTNTVSGIWSSSNTSVATIGSASGIYTGVAVGTTTMTYTHSSVCYVTSAVTVNPAIAMPRVSSITPAIAAPGTAMTITGTDFNPTASNNIVYMGAVRATVTSASPTSLTAAVPIGATFKQVSVYNTDYQRGSDSRKLFLPTFDNSGPTADSITLSAKTDFVAGTRPYSVTASDLDGDGKADVIVTNGVSNTISIYRNTASPGIIDSNSLAPKVDLTANSAFNAAVGDIDGDGKPDIVAGSGGDSRFSVFRNIATPGSITSSSFEAKVDFPVAPHPIGHIAIADIDYDGRYDVIAACETGIFVWRNKGTAGVIDDSTFSSYQLFLNPSSNPANEIVVADMDGDGREDILCSSNTGGSVYIFRNTSIPGYINNTSFAAPITLATGGTYRVTVGDIDGDGKPDIIAVGVTTLVFKNISTAGSLTTSSFAASVSFSPGGGKSVVLADIDGNGKPDIVTTSTHVMSVYRNTTTAGIINAGSFAAKKDYTAGTEPNHLAVADIDGDSKPDIIVPNDLSGTISIFRNNASSAIIGGTTVCVGAVSTLSHAVSGGTWSSSDTGKVVVNLTSGVITGVTAGTAVVTYSYPGVTSTVVIGVTPLPDAGSITGPGTVDSGATITLSATAAGGTWSSSTAAASITSAGIVTGVSVGTTIISYQRSNVCGSGTATQSVTITTPLPPITGTFSLSGTGGTTLSHPTPGGVWSTPCGSIASVSPSGFVTGISSGLATITYAVGSAFAFAVVTVSAAPSAIVGDLTTCAGSITTLSYSAGSGTWSSSNPAVAIAGPAGIVTGISAGTSVITYTYGPGCSSTAVATINAAADAGTLTGPSSVTVGGTGTLSSTVGGGTWGASNSNATVSGGEVTGVAVGTVTISYTVTNSCGTAVATKLMTVAAPAVGSITGALSVCSGGATTLSNTTVGGTWSSSNSTIAAVTAGGVVTGGSPGIATITYTAGGGFVTAAVTVNALPAGITGVNNICQGATATLATSTTGGAWGSSDDAIADISTAGVVTGVNAGTATVSYSSGYGCVRTTVVTVNASPVITGIPAVCPGAATTLTVSVGGGTWTGGTTTIATVGSAGVLTGIGAGTTNISYTVGGSCTATAIVTVGPAPATITGTMKACPGTSTALSNTTAGGSWSTSDVTIATADATTGVITGIAAGTVTVTYTTGAGCYRTTTVTINPAPAAIAGAAVICAGSSVTLTDVTPGLSWGSGNTAVATIGAGTGVVTGVSTGLATITYTAASTNCITTAIMTVNGIPAAIAGPATGCTGSNITLTNSVPGGAWSSSNTATATVDATTGVVMGIASGIVTITYSTGSGCYKTKQITINSSPSVSGYPTVCVGLTTTLSGGGYGTWSSSAPGTATIATSGGYVTGVAAGTATMTFTSGSSVCPATYVVTVIPVPAAITGTTTACTGTIVTLSNTTPGGSWSSSNTAGATVGSTTGIVNAVGTGGTVTISYSFGTNCRVTTPFTLKPLPAVIAGSPSVCMPVTTTLTTTTSGGTWTSSNTSVATIGTAISASYGLVTGVSSGTSSITYTITATGCARSTVVTIDAGLNPGTITSSGGFTLHTVSAPTSVTLSSTGAAGGTWSSSNTAVATVNLATGVVTAIAAGSTTITYAVTANCTNIVTRVVNVVASRRASGQSSVSSVQLYPNPTSGAFTLVSDEAGTLHLFSIDGKELTNYSIGAGINSLSLPKELAAGVYMCRYTSESGNTTMVRLVYEK